MGDFGPRFLQALAGNVVGQAPSPVGVVPPEAGGEINPGMKMFGVTPNMLRGPTATMPGEVGGMPVPPTGDVGGGMGPEAEAVVRGFKPKKISFWGALGDQLMKHWGNKPVFEERINNINMQRAMEGFTNDPAEAIRRIGQIPGMQKQAWDLWNTYEDNNRQREVAQASIGDKRERIINRANQLFGSVLPDGRNWPTVRQLYLNILERNGITDVYLPEEFDRDVINAQIAGGMTFNQQDLAKYRPREQARKEANTASAIERREAQTRQGDERIAQGDRAEAGRDRRAAAAEAGKDRRSANQANKDGTTTRKLKDGSSVRYSPDKSTAIVTRPNGKKHYLQRQLDGSYKTVDPSTLKAN